MAAAVTDPTVLQHNIRERILAPVVMASMLSCISLGFVAALTLTYLARFVRRDRCAFRALVVFLSVAAVVDTACQCSLSMDWAVVGFGNYAQFRDTTPWQLPSYCFTTGIPVCLVQLAFGHRVWVMSGRSRCGGVLVGFIVAGALAALGCITRCCAFFLQHHNLLEFNGMRPIFIAWLFLLVAVDILITISCLWYLVHKPKRDSGGLIKTDSRVQRLASIAAKTNVVSLVCQISILALIFAYPYAFHYVTTCFIMSKIYTASLIAMLNLRDPSTLLCTTTSAFPQARWSNPVEPCASVVAAADEEEGRHSPLSLALVLQQEPPTKEEKDKAARSRAFETKMSVVRSAGKNVSFCREDFDGRGAVSTLCSSVGEDETTDVELREAEEGGRRR